MVYRWAINLFAKIIQHFEHHTYTNFGISDEFCSGHYDPLGGLGQGMILLGSNNRDKSCLIFKKLEEHVFRFSKINSMSLEKF